MKADIVNPAAPAADRYSRWDEYVAIHRFIQNANTPSTNNVNFGHGGLGAYGFLSWHRYFLLRLELQLQSYVPGVMLPYWDWTDPIGTIAVEDFLGPNGDPAFNIRFFALNKKGEYAGMAMYASGETTYAICTEKGAETPGFEPLLKGSPTE